MLSAALGSRVYEEPNVAFQSELQALPQVSFPWLHNVLLDICSWLICVSCSVWEHLELMNL